MTKLPALHWKSRFRIRRHFDRGGQILQRCAWSRYEVGTDGSSGASVECRGSFSELDCSFWWTRFVEAGRVCLDRGGKAIDGLIWVAAAALFSEGEVVAIWRFSKWTVLLESAQAVDVILRAFDLRAHRSSG